MKYEEKITELRCRIQEETAVISELAVALEGNAAQTHRHDQAAVVHGLRDRVMSEVGSIRRMEAAVAGGHSAGAATVGFGTLALGVVLSAASGHRSLQRIGTSLLTSPRHERPPFGKVMVVVGKGGIPEDVKVLSVSGLAREAGKSESAVEVAQRHSGYTLMTPEAFAEMLDTIERGLLNGSVALPVGIGEFKSAGRSETPQRLRLR